MNRLVDNPAASASGSNGTPSPTADPALTHLERSLKHEKPLISCKYDTTSRFIFASSEDQSIVRWDLKAEKPETTKVSLLGHESWAHALECTPDGSSMLSGACDGRLIWWPTAAEKPVPSRTIEAHAGWINSVAISADGALVATAGNDRYVRVWSASTGEKLQELPGHERPVYKVAFVPGGKFLLTADLQGRVFQWEMATWKEVRRFDAVKLYKYEPGQQVDYGGVRDLAFDTDCSKLVCCGLIEASNPLGAVSNPANLVFDWSAGGEPLLQRPKADVKGVAWGVRWHPSGFIIMVSGGTGGGFLFFFKPDQANEFATFNLGNTGRGIDLHPDSLRVATAHHDGNVRISAMFAKPKG